MHCSKFVDMNNIALISNTFQLYEWAIRRILFDNRQRQLLRDEPMAVADAFELYQLESAKIEASDELGPSHDPLLPF